MTSSHVPAFLRKLVIRRAKNKCEYCRLSQVGQEATFHVDHVIPVASGGKTDAENLALACVSCSLRKGSREISVDPLTTRNVRLFNPREDEWKTHFEWTGNRLKGRTEIGRATIEVLKLNRTLIIAIRKEELLLGRDFD